MPIGQAVDQKQFECLERKVTKSKRKIKLIHVGRLDPSKDIVTLISVFHENFKDSDAILHLVGASTSSNREYLSRIEMEIKNRGLESKVILHGEQNQKEIRRLLCDSDIFIHAFIGSLDKSLIEAVISRIFVISCNSNFFKVFGSLTGEPKAISAEKFLNRELSEYRRRPLGELNAIVQDRYNIALRDHSRSQWIKKVVRILGND